MEERREELARERRRLCGQRGIDTYTKLRYRAEVVDNLVSDLKKAGEIREFVDRVHDSCKIPIATKRLARWASEYAKHLDPLLDFRLEKLDESIREQKPAYWY